MKQPSGVGRLLTSMDAKAAASLAVSAILMIVVFVILIFGQSWIGLDDEGGLSRFLREVGQSYWAVPAVVAVFIVLALTGFPQWFLIAGTILAFGPREGAFYSWLATMISATVTFGLGHWLGGPWLRRFGGERTQDLIGFIGRHGILASGLIRVIPSGPFIVVNAAAGAAHVPLWKYLAGTSVGIIPKILLVVALGALAPDHRSFSAGLGGLAGFFATLQPADYALFAGVAGGWLGFLFVVRRIYLSIQRRDGGH
ncbi:MAG: TVP38/TMEM64 family protein [Parvularculaceae bacterium]